MITKIILLSILMVSILTNAYYAGQGKMVKSKNICISDTITGLALFILVLIGWDW